MQVTPAMDKEGRKYVESKRYVAAIVWLRL